MTAPKKTASTADRRMFFVSLGIFVAVLLLVGASFFSWNGPPAPTLPAGAMTLPPNVILNLTQVSETLGDDLRVPVEQLRTQVANCPAYGDERRSQMNQHINWLLEPASLPQDMIIALGANPIGRLIFGMATYTSIEWRLADRPAESCLLIIGRTLNTLLAQTGEQPFEEFN